MKDPIVKRKKLKAMLVVGILLALIYAKNLIERQSFKEMGRAFTEVYEDRLVVKGYIFDISESLFEIQKLIDHCDLAYDYSEVIGEIQANEESILLKIEEFEKTKLTSEEAGFLQDFKGIIKNDLKIESYDLLFTDSSGVNSQQVRLYDQKISKARIDLEKLSEIQVVEGQKLTTKAKKLLNRSQIWAQFEVALLLILILVLYLLVIRDSKYNKGVVS